MDKYQSLRAYDARNLGGNEPEVKKLLLEVGNGDWDQSVVDALICLGAEVPLHKVGRVIQMPRFRTAICTFVHPSGRLVSDVSIPVATLKLRYEKHVKHL